MVLLWHGSMITLSGSLVATKILVCIKTLGKGISIHPRPSITRIRSSSSLSSPVRSLKRQKSLGSSPL